MVKDMEKRKIILASNSPRRHELLLSAGIEHDVLKLDVDETPDTSGFSKKNGMFAEYYAMQSAAVKADAAELTVFGERDKENENSLSDAIIVTADTVVSPDGNTIFGKPSDEREAAEFLRTLSGREHFVVGGICVVDINFTALSSVVTKVKFKELGEDEIRRYIKTGEPFDKAGAYGIQGLGAFFAESIEGDYSNVVGISIFELGRLLEKYFSYELF